MPAKPISETRRPSPSHAACHAVPKRSSSTGFSGDIITVRSAKRSAGFASQRSNCQIITPTG